MIFDASEYPIKIKDRRFLSIGYNFFLRFTPLHEQ